MCVCVCVCVRQLTPLILIHSADVSQDQGRLLAGRARCRHTLGSPPHHGVALGRDVTSGRAGLVWETLTLPPPHLLEGLSSLSSGNFSWAVRLHKWDLDPPKHSLSPGASWHRWEETKSRVLFSTQVLNKAVYSDQQSWPVIPTRRLPAPGNV